MAHSTMDDLQAAAGDDRRQAQRRKSPRARVQKAAQIIWLGGAPIRCTVRNLSASGACLEVEREIPRDTFDLVFDADQSRRYCRVAWRQSSRIGVKFR
ncbi:MAG TPA: PilZ domain-containing protein [Methylovirgula sp.]|nr:PilZ domain-containing protein [Methylovirgula sp.]